MTVYWVDVDKLEIKQESFDVGNLMAFSEEMDQTHQDGWFGNEEDALENLKDLLED